MNQDELIRKFENKLNTWEAGLQVSEFTEVDCSALAQDMKTIEADEELMDKVIIDNNLLSRFLEVYLQLANKMVTFGNTNGALGIIARAKLYSAGNQDANNKLEALEQQIKNPPKAAPVVRMVLLKIKNPVRL